MHYYRHLCYSSSSHAPCKFQNHHKFSSSIAYQCISRHTIPSLLHQPLITRHPAVYCRYIYWIILLRLRGINDKYQVDSFQPFRIETNLVPRFHSINAVVGLNDHSSISQKQKLSIQSHSPLLEEFHHHNYSHWILLGTYLYWLQRLELFEWTL